MSRILFLSYDGILEDIGQSQILPYCERLAKKHQITILTFEKHADILQADCVQRQTAQLNNLGVRWIPLHYHKSPPVLSTFYDLTRMLIAVLIESRRNRMEIIHARSTPPAVVALAVKFLTNRPFIYDMKGFWAQQRVETGAWRAGFIYHLARLLERAALQNADHVISETTSGVEILRRDGTGEIASAKYSVVPTCVDVRRFRHRSTRGERFVLGFVGSFATGYLLDPMLLVFKQIRARIPAAHFKIITRAEPTPLLEAFRRHSIPNDAFTIRPARPHQVPGELSEMDGGVYFLKPSPAMRAVSPTKLPEFLASGVPIITGPSIGDTDRVLRERGVGVIADPYDETSLATGVDAFLLLAKTPGIEGKCRNTAEELFDVSVGVHAFDRAYDQVAKC